MNIYFACSLTGGRELETVYQAIARALAEKGHKVLTAHLVESNVMEVEAAFSPSEVYLRDTAWIHKCDVLVAEVSVPSHGVGYEIGFALGIGKPVLALYQEGRKVSKMISGNPDKNLTVKIYATADESIQVLTQFLATRG
ncbi:MAG TPA: nucleoside 2-deoxyribosyltransferase [Anaerolineales bacterium]|nr:nucleoside 2-deoxyribosyltransferase [Anaerolineales bacterium]